MMSFAVSDFPVVEQLSFDVVYEPAAPIELCNDWYDIFRLPDGRVVFSVGDVCGKGLGAAVKMGQAMIPQRRIRRTTSPRFTIW